MAKRSASSVRDARAGRKGARTGPTRAIDFSDIPEASDEQLRSMRRVSRPPVGATARRLIAIRVDPHGLSHVEHVARCTLSTSHEHVGRSTSHVSTLHVAPGTSDVLERYRKEARRRKIGYQTLINEVLAQHVGKKDARPCRQIRVCCRLLDFKTRNP
jgi:uncharacterized protein (DUF4415 family)